LGAPYRFGGSSVRGLDCSAFVKKIYQFFDITLPRTAREQSRVGKLIAREDLKEGDLIFFNTRRAIGHVGIYIGNNEFVHAASGQQRMVKIDTLEKPYYDKRFAKAVRIKELKEEL
jgi:peptidoglycan endopeptidase LytE